jgi:hypothetical protein
LLPIVDDGGTSTLVATLQDTRERELSYEEMKAWLQGLRAASVQIPDDIAEHYEV